VRKSNEFQSFGAATEQERAVLAGVWCSRRQEVEHSVLDGS